MAARSERPVEAVKADDVEWLTYDGAGKIIGVCEKTVRLYVKQGRLKATKLSYKVVRIHRRDVDEFMERNRKQ